LAARYLPRPMGDCIIGSASYPAGRPPLAVAVGNFDGVHLGHRAVLARLRAHAASLGAPAAVYTFDPAPTAVLAPERHQPRLVSLEERVRRLFDAGADVVVVEPFSRAWAAHPAEWFADVVLGQRLRACAVTVGHDFRFGAGRRGDPELLRSRLDAPVDVLSAVQAGGAPISSSRIRRLVADGEVREAAALLGAPHLLVGTVVHGDARGRTIGFPTANLLLETELLPSHGVYAVRAWSEGLLADAAAVMNVGVRPTVDGARVSVEVHVLDGAPDLYGRTMRVDVVERLRAERRFDGLDALVEQIRRDVAQARSVLT
jgi:riboflavin kinase/FMN adenylyltransferase